MWTLNEENRTVVWKVVGTEAGTNTARMMKTVVRIWESVDGVDAKSGTVSILDFALV